MESGSTCPGSKERPGQYGIRELCWTLGIGRLQLVGLIWNGKNGADLDEVELSFYAMEANDVTQVAAQRKKIFHGKCCGEKPKQAKIEADCGAISVHIEPLTCGYLEVF